MKLLQLRFTIRVRRVGGWFWICLIKKLYQRNIAEVGAGAEADFWQLTLSRRLNSV